MSTDRDLFLAAAEPALAHPDPAPLDLAADVLRPARHRRRRRGALAGSGALAAIIAALALAPLGGGSTPDTQQLVPATPVPTAPGVDPSASADPDSLATQDPVIALPPEPSRSPVPSPTGPCPSQIVLRPPPDENGVPAPDPYAACYEYDRALTDEKYRLSAADRARVEAILASDGRLRAIVRGNSVTVTSVTAWGANPTPRGASLHLVFDPPLSTDTVAVPDLEQPGGSYRGRFVAVKEADLLVSFADAAVVDVFVNRTLLTGIVPLEPLVQRPTGD